MIWFFCNLSAFNSIACATPLRCFCTHVLSPSCMLFKACIPAYLCEFVVCSFDRGGYGYGFVIWARDVCQNPLSSMDQQVTGMENSWLCVCFMLFKWILFVFTSFTRWLGVCHLWCESHLSFTFGLYLLIYHFTFWFLCPYFLLFLFLGYQLQVPSISTTSSRWSWDHEDERRRQEKWQLEQERLLQVPPNHINALFDSWFFYVLVLVQLL